MVSKFSAMYCKLCPCRMASVASAMVLVFVHIFDGVPYSKKSFSLLQYLLLSASDPLANSICTRSVQNSLLIVENLYDLLRFLKVKYNKNLHISL